MTEHRVTTPLEYNSLPFKFQDAGVTVYQCSCGSFSFMVRSDGRAECTGCHKFPPFEVKRK